MYSKITESALDTILFRLQEDNNPVIGAPKAIVAIAAAVVFFKKSLLFSSFSIASVCGMLYMVFDALLPPFLNFLEELGVGCPMSDVGRSLDFNLFVLLTLYSCFSVLCS